MYPGHYAIDSLAVETRSRDFLAEAAHERRLAQAAGRIIPTVRPAARWTIGVRVIRAGERIRGTSPAPAITGS